MTGALSEFRTRSPADTRRDVGSRECGRSEERSEARRRTLRRQVRRGALRTDDSESELEEVRNRSLRSDENRSPCEESIGTCAAVLSRRFSMDQRVPFLEKISKRGADDNNVNALGSLIQLASRRVAGRSEDSSPASTVDTTPKGWSKNQDPQASPGGPERSGVVDFGGLEIIEFEMSPELAESNHRQADSQ